MNVALDIAMAPLERQITAQIKSAVDAVEHAMAVRFHELTLGNFGIAGVDRPIHWAPLSGAYARKVHRQIATLYVTGALKNAIKVERNVVSVSNDDVPYALAHQYGYAKGGLPARPYFPIRANGSCMPYTFSQLVEAAEKKFNELFPSV